MTMLSAISKLLREIADKIDSGGCYISKEQQMFIFDELQVLAQNNDRVSKYDACKYLHVSRATFDRLVSDGKIPQGEHQQGFKELSWKLKDLDCYKTMLKK